MVPNLELEMCLGSFAILPHDGHRTALLEPRLAPTKLWNHAELESSLGNANLTGLLSQFVGARFWCRECGRTSE